MKAAAPRCGNAQIVFSADSMPKSSMERLEIVNADGTGHRVLIDKDGPGFLEAAWSPDGTEIAFTGGGGYYGCWIGIIRPDGGGYRRIARHCSGRDPRWSPDGRRIVFSDPYSLAVVNSDGSALRRIPDTWDGYSPAWSDNGIAFLRFETPVEHRLRPAGAPVTPRRSLARPTIDP